MELYYAITNIIDFCAVNGKELDKEFIDILDKLAEKGDLHIEDIADANDCGICTTWQELLAGFCELYKTGNRI